jgi:hypothetical protein
VYIVLLLIKIVWNDPNPQPDEIFKKAMALVGTTLNYYIVLYLHYIILYYYIVLY